MGVIQVRFDKQNNIWEVHFTTLDKDASKRNIIKVLVSDKEGKVISTE